MQSSKCLAGSKTRRGESAREKDRNEGVHMKPFGTGHWQSYPLNGGQYTTSPIVTELPRCFARSFTIEGILIPCGHHLTGKFAFGQARHECAGGASNESATRLGSFSAFRRIDKMSTVRRRYTGTCGSNWHASKARRPDRRNHDVDPALDHRNIQLQSGPGDVRHS